MKHASKVPLGLCFPLICQTGGFGEQRLTVYAILIIHITIKKSIKFFVVLQGQLQSRISIINIVTNLLQK